MYVNINIYILRQQKDVRQDVNILRSMGRDGFIYLFIIEYGKLRGLEL